MTTPAEPQERTVRITSEGVQFGNAWYSHERITGYTAEALNSGGGRVTGKAYLDWLAGPASEPKAAREISIETRNGETAPEYQVRLTIGVRSFDISSPRETMVEATWLVEQLGKALDAAAPAVPAEPVAWLHEAQEPDSPPLTLLSRDDANPWAHWRDDHKAKCVFKSTPLYASPAASPSVLRQAVEALTRSNEEMRESLENEGRLASFAAALAVNDAALSALLSHLAARPVGAHSWDEKALETARAIVNSREPNHTRYLAKAQLAVLDAMRWASPAPDHIVDANKMVTSRPVGALSDERRNAITDQAFDFFGVPPREREEGLATYIIQLTEEALAASAPVGALSLSDEREKFEAWARQHRKHYPLDRTDYPGDHGEGDYVSSKTHEAWSIWQARAAAQTSPAAGDVLAELPEDQQKWLRDFERESSFDPLYLDQLDGTPEKFAEVAKLNLRWLEDWSIDMRRGLEGALDEMLDRAAAKGQP